MDNLRAGLADASSIPHARLAKRGFSLLIAGVLVLAVSGPLSSASAQPSNFLTSDYGTGTVFAEGRACWVGYPFQVNEAIEVTALIGSPEFPGGSSKPIGYEVAIFEGGYAPADEEAAQDGLGWTGTGLIASATFTESGEDQAASLSSPVVLEPGTWYFLGGGFIEDDSVSGPYVVEEFDPVGMTAPGSAISTWAVAGDGTNRSLSLPPCVGSASDLATLSSDDSSNVRPSYGFAYGPAPEPEPPTPTPTSTPTPGPTPGPVAPSFTG